MSNMYYVIHKSIRSCWLLTVVVEVIPFWLLPAATTARRRELCPRRQHSAAAAAVLAAVVDGRLDRLVLVEVGDRPLRPQGMFPPL